MGNLGLIPGLGRSPGEGKGYPLQYSGLQNSMDCIAHGVTKSWTQTEQLSLSLFIKLFNHLLTDEHVDNFHLFYIINNLYLGSINFGENKFIISIIVYSNLS